MKIITLIIVIILILLMLLILWLPSFVMTGKRQTYEESFTWQTEHYDTSFYDELSKTDYTVTASDGYILHAELLENPVPSTEYVIITHGYTDNMMGALKYAWVYLDLGYNCIIYDLRGHGRNEPTFTTYGIREADDLLCMISDTKERYPDLTSLGLHGESLGSATTVTCMKYKPDVDFAVADCGFADIISVLKGSFSNDAAASLILGLADLGARIRYHYSLKDMRPIDALDSNEIPILFIHGAEDRFILPEHSKQMCARTKGYSEYHEIPGAVHAESAVTAPELYEEIVANFLKTCGQR